LANFDKAELIFQKVLAQNPHDQAARYYLDRSVQHQTYGTPDNWAGIDIMDFK
jgi:hypothetical protein